MRILIWLDHMGLRVATLVNLSFLGMDKLEQRLARCAGPGGDIPLHSRGRQALHHVGAAAHPVLYPPRHGLGSRLERSRGHSTVMSTADFSPALAGLPVTEKLLVLAGAVVDRAPRSSRQPAGSCSVSIPPNSGNLVVAQCSSTR